MKNGQKYAKQINRMVNQEFFECSLWSIRNGKKASEYCCPVPESFDPANGPASGSDEFCKKCLCESLEWLNQEYKEEILSDDEKDIVKEMIDVILKFGCTVIDVRKIDIGNCDSFISIRYENTVIRTNDTLSSPIIDNDKFKGMKLNRKYTLEELGITCQTQKDN